MKREETIEELQRLHSKIQKRLKVDKRKVSKRLFWFTIVTGIFLTLGMNSAVTFFGSSTLFFITVVSCYLIVILIYVFRVIILKRKRQKELKKINLKLYQLYKLNV